MGQGLKIVIIWQKSK